PSVEMSRTAAAVEAGEEVSIEAAPATSADDAEAAEFLARTGIYVRPGEAGAGGEIGEQTVVAPHGQMGDLGLAAAIDEVADVDSAGARPLVDVFADIGLPEAAPQEPLTGDLSVDLEGGDGGTIDEEAYAASEIAPLED